MTADKHGESELQNFADVEQPDKFTNLNRDDLNDDQNIDGFSQEQEFVNEAPDLGLVEDDGMIGFDDFDDDFK